MRTTLDLDADLLQRALEETGARSKAAVIEMGLNALLEREARKRLKALFGKGPQLMSVRRSPDDPQTRPPASRILSRAD